MSGLEIDYDGKVSTDKEIKPEDISFVFQQFAILPWLTVYENVELNLLAGKLSESERKKRVMEELQRFGLEKFSSSKPKELSGGLKQRVGLARAFASKPKIIFMDEPFSELDSFTAEELRKDFLKIWKDSKETVVMVTHLIDEALELADRIAVLTPRPGRIEKVLVNSLPRPRHKRSEDFFKLEDEVYRLIKP
jgi:NitT/TauT family transport system ATP-binding protein